MVSLSAAACVGEIVRRRRLNHLVGAARIAAQSLVTTIALAFTVFVPGVCGVLTRGTASACALAMVAAAAFIPWTTGRPRNDEKASRPAGRLSLGVASLAALVAGAWMVGELLHTVAAPLMAVDFTSYDLPVISHWVQTGSLWHITELFPLQTHGTYPQNAHLVIATVILAFHNDALLRFLVYPFLLLTGVALYAIACELGARRSTAVTFAAMFICVPNVALDIEAAPPDTLALAAFTIGLLFLIRHYRSQLTSDLVLAGLGLGFAAGSLWYYASGVAVLALTWAAWKLLRTRRPTAAAREIGLLAGLIAACSLFWLIRNWVGTGDPVYPVKVAIAGITLFNAPPDIYRAISGFSIANYLGDLSVLRHYIGPALGKALGLPGLVIFVGFLWSLVREFVGRRRGRAPHRLRGMLLLAGLLLAVLYVLTPYSAFGSRDHPILTWVNARYLLPALTIAVALAAAAFGRPSGRSRAVVEVVALGAALQGVHEAYVLLNTPRAAIAEGAAIAAIVGCSAYLWRRAERPVLRSRSAAVLSAGVAGVVFVMVSYGAQRRLNRNRYASLDATYAWVQRHPAPTKIGLAGSWNFVGASPAWAMFGPRLQNEVSFVGQLRGDHLIQYRTSEQWLRALRLGHYDLVEIARNAPGPATSNEELRWVAKAKFPVVAESTRFELVGVNLGAFAMGGSIRQ